MVLIKLLNQLLAELNRHEPSVQVLVDALKPHVLHVHITDLDQHLYYHGPTASFEKTSEDRVDAAIQASSVALFFAGLSSRLGQSPSLKGVQIEGDMEVALLLQTLLQNLSIDPQALLANHVGETPAAMAMSTLRFGKRLMHVLHEEVRASVQKDKAICVSRDEISAFCDTVDDLVARVDRLEAKVALERSNG